MFHILVVEDDAKLRSLFCTVLNRSGYLTVPASGGREALELLDSEYIDLIISDIMMPGMDGFTLLKILQEENNTKTVPVIMITALSDIEHEQRGLTLGAVDYISKPFSPLIVKARVDTHIKLYNYRRQVERQSKTDQMTGIANRRRHDEYSVEKWKESVRLRTPFSICMFDIDHFKSFNDTFGHPAGDRVIASVAKTIASYLHRSTDFFARYGGEEFVAILLGDDSDRVFEYIKTIRQAVEDLHIPHNPAVSEWVTVSIGGITIIPDAEKSYDFYLKIADAMLYDAKKFGRNRVVWADERIKQLYEK